MQHLRETVKNVMACVAYIRQSIFPLYSTLAVTDRYGSFIFFVSVPSVKRSQKRSQILYHFFTAEWFL